MTLCFLGLGSNLGSPRRKLKLAINLLHTLPRSIIINQSSVYHSRPCGVRSQPLYCNMVIGINTSLSALHLLKYCQHIETKCHRIRKRRWGARTIDIDVLLYGEQVIDHHELKVPHPEMTHRDFVLVPLLEISPQACLPSGQPLVSYLSQCKPYLTK